MNILLRALLASLLTGVLVACGAGTYQSYEDAAYAGAICTDPAGYRVPDSYCPIGDGPPPAGYAYSWAYRPYRSTDRDIDVVYVGYPVDTHVWVHTRPANVATLNIDRGSFPETEPAGQPRASSARIATEPVRRAGSSSVTRGGLGSTSAAPVTNANKPAPPPKRIGPPPAGARPMAAAKAKK